jgi:hypothetical protein
LGAFQLYGCLLSPEKNIFFKYYSKTMEILWNLKNKKNMGIFITECKIISIWNILIDLIKGMYIRRELPCRGK